MTRERLGVLRDLFVTFAKMGAITFGGGMAMLPILQREVVYTRHWATEEEVIDYYAIGQCTPGVIAVNTSTFIGQKQAGIPGGIVATLGMVFPSLAFISLIAGLLSNFADIAAVRNAFAGIQVCVCVLIFNATMKLLKKSVIDGRTAVIFALVLAGNVVLNLSPVWFVLSSAVTGAALKALEARHAAKHAEKDSNEKITEKESATQDAENESVTQSAENESDAVQSAETESAAKNGENASATQSAENDSVTQDAAAQADAEGIHEPQADNDEIGAETERENR